MAPLTVRWCSLTLYQFQNVTIKVSIEVKQEQIETDWTEYISVTFLRFCRCFREVACALTDCDSLLTSYLHVDLTDDVVRNKQGCYTAKASGA